ncbi:AMP-binding protein [Amaricoccus tamworthensis]|uniref:AMP-binding protein n=1 Tax=Amaricoccus tamworthensis TaxID=57002 RepID=UPI003C7E038E
MRVYKSHHPDVHIPDTTVSQLVMDGISTRLSEPVLVDGHSGRSVTGAELADGIRRFAGGLLSRGLGSGAVTAILLPNIPEFATVFHGIAWAGGTATPMNAAYTAPEIRHQLQASGARLAVTIPPLLEQLEEAIPGTGVEEIVVIGDSGDHTSLEDFFGEPVEAQMPVDPATHLVSLPYSSGTTGLPKGVMLTHRNLVSNICQADAFLKVQPGEVTLGVLPYFHIYGKMILNLYLARGGAHVTMMRFDLEQALQLIQDHRMKMLYVVPPIVLGLAKHPMVDKFDLSSVEGVLSGAAPLGADLGRACAGRIGCRALQGYGMTEASPVTHLIPRDDEHHGSAGLVVPNVECRIISAQTGADVEPGEEGELLVRGPNVMTGYLNNPDATAKTLDADGWLHTGDVARVDDEGYFFVVDRVKELIKYKGFQVAPAEIEALLVTHPAVADVAVIGRPDDESGEVPMAVIQPTPDMDKVTLAELQDFLSTRTAKYKQIQDLRYVEAIPKSASGKILRRVLRDELLEPEPA